MGSIVDLKIDLLEKDNFDPLKCGRYSFASERGRQIATLIAMSATADKIRDSALTLPPDERAWLASELIASLDEGTDPGVEAAWAAEIERRIAEVEAGAETTSWEEARARIRVRIAKS